MIFIDFVSFLISGCILQITEIFQAKRHKQCIEFRGILNSIYNCKWHIVVRRCFLTSPRIFYLKNTIRKEMPNRVASP